LEGEYIMPDWINYYNDYVTDSASTSSSTWGLSASIQQMYEEYMRQDHIMEQMMCEDAEREAELEEDKKKYPLFYWKDGIV